MNFESKFLDKFHKESEFPTPRPLSMKRRKSFSDQFFKSGFGSTLKLSGKGTLKLSGKAAQKIRSKFNLSPLKSRQLQQNETCRTPVELQFSENSRSSFYGPCSQSSSIECLPISTNVDSYLPIPNKSSVITLPKYKTMKISSRSKFGTFRRSDGPSSPYGTILKGRMNKTRPQLSAVEFDRPNSPFCSSPISCNVPLSQFLDSSFSSTFSLPAIINSELKTSFYGQENQTESLLRTDYSCRMSQKWKKREDNKITSNFINRDDSTKMCKMEGSLESLYCTEIKPKILDSKTREEEEEEEEEEQQQQQQQQQLQLPSPDNVSLFSDETSNLDLVSQNSDSTKPKFADGFHKELLDKCSKFNRRYSFESNSALSFESQNQCRLYCNSPLKLELSELRTPKESDFAKKFENARNIINSNVSPRSTELTSHYKVSVKPQLLPKPCILPKPEVLLERSLVKPDIPVKPDKLKTEKITSPITREINNNFIVLKPANKTLLKNSLPSIMDAYNENRQLLIQSSDNYNNPKINTLDRDDDIEAKMTDSSRWTENFKSFQGSKVKNLVASFNHAFKSANIEANRFISPRILCNRN